MSDNFILRLGEDGTLRIRFPDGAELSLDGEEAEELGRKLIAAAEGSGDTTITIHRDGHRYIINVVDMH